MHILVVEDEKDLNRILVKRLKEENYNVDSCFDGQSAVDYLEHSVYDGAVMDVMMPGMDGFEVLRTIRKKGIDTPVLFLTARDDTKDIVEGLSLGADDYIVKPFVFEELLMRIKVMLRRKPEVAEDIYRCGNLELNNNTHTVTRGGFDITLSPREFAVLLFLIRNQGMVVTRAQIEENIWDMDYDGYSNVIDVYIRYLRKKIDDGFDYKMIQTIRGVGYMLKCQD